MRRREYPKAAGAGAPALAAAGCLEVRGGGPSGPLTIATDDPFFGDEGTAGRWLKDQWEADHDVDVEFTAPDAGVDELIQRAKQGADSDADLFVGLNTPEIVRVDEQRPDQQLFDDVSSEVEGTSDVKEFLRVDPEGRAVADDTGYIWVVYDGTEVENPGAFDALLDPAYEGTLLAQNAQSSDPGLAFRLWTVHEKGAEGYLDYWQGLVENDVRVLDDWQPAYNAFLNDERPIVVSYSTDQVYHHEEDQLPHHQVGFLNDEGYAYEPPDPVTFTYDELAGNVEGWTESWAKQVASN